MIAKYINPFTDFGFKKIFGEEACKPLLIDFLNSLLPLHSKINKISFENKEQLGNIEFYQKGIYTIYCQNEKSEQFIVQLQKAERNYFKGRIGYYSSFLLREQVEKGSWNYNFKGAYCIGILNFTFNDYETKSKKSEVIQTIKLKNHGKLLYDKLTYVYLEMPNFTKAEDQLKTRLDQWLYFIKSLEDFETIPAIFEEEVFTNAFDRTALDKFDQLEMNNYQSSLKVFRDNINTFDYARQTAYEAGRAEGRRIAEMTDIVALMKNKGFAIKDIAELTGFSENEIEKMQ